MRASGHRRTVMTMEQRSMGLETTVVAPVLRAPLRRPRRTRRRRGDARVRSDPAVRRAERQADQQYDEWRRAFAQLLMGLPESRRVELRRRLGRPAGA
jgi:hypothetical protein